MIEPASRRPAWQSECSVEVWVWLALHVTYLAQVYNVRALRWGLDSSRASAMHLFSLLEL